MNTPTTSLKEVMQAYSNLLTRENDMKAENGNDKYYDIQKILIEEIRVFLRMNFTYLNTRQLLKLCSMVQAYRPVALHSFLITCGNLIND